MSYQVGTIEAVLQARLDDKNFDKFDRAVAAAKRSVDSMSAGQIKQAAAMRKAGMATADIAKKLGVSEKAAKDMTRAQDRATVSTEKMGRATKTAGSQMKTAVRYAIGLAAAYVGIGQAKAAITTTLEFNKAVQGLNRNLGLSVEQASRWATVAKARDIDTKSLTMSFTALSRKIEDAKGGSESALDVFESLGISQQELTSGGQSFQAQLEKVAKALGEAEGGTTRQAAAQQLLGRGYQTVLPLFTEGTKSMKEQLRWADEFNTVVGKEQSDALGEVTTELRRNKVAMFSLQQQFTIGMAPAIRDASKQFQDFVKVLSDPNLTDEQKTQRIAAQLERLSDRILDIVERMAPQVAERAGRIGIAMAKGIAQTFVNSGWLGKLAIGVWFIQKMGGWSALAGMGARAGGRLAKGLGKKFVTTVGPYFGITAGAESLGGAFAARFPRLAAFFKGKGRAAGHAFGLAFMTAAVIALVREAMNNKDGIQSLKNVGLFMGQSIVNGLISAVNAGIRQINQVLDEANILGKLGVDAPNIGTVDPVNWDPNRDRQPQHWDQGKGPRITVRGGKHGGFVSPHGIIGMKSGGRVPGVHPDDTVPAMLEPGEFVMRKKAVDKLGVPFLRTLNNKGKVADEARDGKKEIGKTFEDLGKETKRSTEKTERQVVKTWASMRKKTTDSQKDLQRSVKDSWRDIDLDHTKRTRDMDQTTGKRFRGMLKTVRSRGGDMETAMGSTMESLQGAVIGGMSNIARQTNRALRAFGVETVNFGVTERDSQQFAGGGFIAGQGKQDTVPLVMGMAAPGEAILSGPQQAEVEQSLATTRALGLGNYGSLDSLFANVTTPHYAYARGGRIPKFSQGGSIGVDGAKPGFVPLMNFLNSMYGPIYTMSGLRPGSITTSGNISNHATGNAVDISTTQNGLNFASSAATLNATGPAATRMDALHAYMARNIGLPGDFLWRTDTGGNHWNHIHRGITSAHADDPELMMRYLATLPEGGMFAQIKRQILTGPDGPLKSLGQAGLDKVKSAAQRYLRRRSSTRMFGIGATVDPHAYPGNQQLGRAMMQTVFPASEWPALQELWMRESGWDETATNPTSGAYGIPQALPPSKMGPAAQGSGPEAAKAQISWGLGYIKNREGYGTPSAALAFHDANGWYSRGGRIPRFAGGGFVGNINRRYAEHNSANGDWGGTVLPKYVIAALAQAAGMPGRTMEQVTRGESGGRPGATGVDPGGTKGYGLWMVTSGFNDALVRKYGGYGEMLNPVKNAAAASEIYKSQGLGAWYGTGAVTGDGTPYTGSYNIQNALGGLGFRGALRGEKPGKSGKPETITRPTGGALPGGGGGTYQTTSAKLQKIQEKLARLRDRAAAKRKRIADRKARWERFRKSQKPENLALPNYLRPFQPMIGDQQGLLAAHSPIAGDLGVYNQMYGMLGRIDPRLAAIRDEYLGTFDGDTTRSVFKKQEQLRRQRQTHEERMREHMDRMLDAALSGGLTGGVRTDGKPGRRKKPGKKEAAKIRADFKREIKRRTAAIRRRFNPAKAMRPITAKRANLQTQFDTLSQRGASVSDLLTQAQTNVQTTARVSSAGSRALAGFASGGYVGAPATLGGTPVVHVTIADPTLSALDPHIEARVNGQLAQVGSVTKQRQRAAGSTGRRARI